MHKTEIWDPCVDREIFNNSGKEKYIYNGDNAKKRLIFVGRLEAEKNIIKLAELFKMLYANDNSFSLTVCGRGGLSALLENIKGITCLGEIDNEKLPQAYKSHDAFVTCSDTETLGNTTIEAMACGLVVVAANAGGTKNIIKDNYNGLLFDAGLLENARNVIVDIFKNPDKMNEISANALLSVEKYNADNSVKKLIGMYSMCLSKFNE
jgi:glycosyltransferase involved in cell wall biosynthesis